MSDNRDTASDSREFRKLLRTLQRRSVASVVDRLPTGRPPTAARSRVLTGRTLRLADKNAALTDKSGRYTTRKLSPRHKRIIAMHLTGRYGFREIAQSVGCSYSLVRHVLEGETAKRARQEIDALQDEELRRLRGQANSVLRNSLMSPRESMRLKAAGMVYKELEKDKAGSYTAEDLMQNILQKIEAENVQINLINTQQG